MPNVERKSKRTVISIEESQPQLDFEEAEHSLPFTFPEYQRELLASRAVAGAADFGIVALIYLVFVIATSLEMPDAFSLDPRYACLRGFGYLISILPLMLGFLWAAIDPEHLTWADKVSGTYVRRYEGCLNTKAQRHKESRHENDL